MTNAEDNATDQGKPPGHWRRAVRSMVWLSGGFVVVLLVSAFLFTPQIALFFLERSLSGAPVIFRAERLEIPDGGTIVIEGIRLADDAGVWARAPRLVMKWHPRALLDGDVDILAIAAPVLHIDRLPKSGAESRSKPFSLSWPRSPLAIRVEALSIPRLVLKLPDAKPVIGEVTAAAQFRDGLLLARLDMNRTDGVAETVTAHIDVNEPARRILFDAAVDAPKGGWISRTLAEATGLAPGAVKVSLEGAGPPEKWGGSLNFALEGLAGGKLDFSAAAPLEEASGKASRRAADEDRDLLLRGEITLGKPLLASLSLPDGLRTRASGPLSLDGRFALRDRLLETAGLQLRLRGLRLEAQGADPWKEIALNLTLSDNIALDDLTVGPGTVRAALSLKENRADLHDLTADISRLDAAGFGLARLQGKMDLSVAWGDSPDSGQILFKGSGTARGLGQTGPDPLRLDGSVTWVADGRFDGARRRIQVKTLRLAQPGFSLTADGRYDLKGPVMAGTVQLRSDRLAALTDGRLRGALRLDASGKSAGETMQLEIKGRASGLSSDEAPGVAALGDIQLAGRADFAADGGRGTFSLTSPAFSITGDGSLDGAGNIHATLAARPQDAAALGRAFGMAIDEKAEFTARVSGPRASPAIEARLDLPRLGEAPFLYRDLKLDLDLRDVAVAPEGRLYVRGDGPLGSMRGVLRLESPAPDHLVIKNILIDNALATFTGNFDINRANGVISGELDGLSGDMSVLERGLDLEADGALSLALRMRARGTAEAPRQVATLSIEGRKMATVLADREAVTADLLDLRMRIVTDGGLLAMKALVAARGRLELKGYRSSGLSLDDLSFVIANRKAGQGVENAAAAQDLDWTLRLAGDYFGLVDLDGAGSLRFGDEETAFTLAKLSGTLVDRPLMLDAPAHYLSRAEGDRFGPLSLHYGGGHLGFSYETAKESLKAALDADKVNIAIIPLALGLPPFDGILTGKAAMTLGAGAPEGEAAFTLRVEDGATEAAEPFTLALAADLSGRADSPAASFTLKGDIKGDGLQGGLRGVIPLQLTRTGARPALTLDRKAPVSAEAHWDGPLESLLAFLPPMNDVMEGHLTADLSLTRTIDDPQLGGRVSLSGGRYEQPGFGTLLENLAVETRLDGNAVTLTSLSANDGEGGTVRAKGQFTLDQDWLPVGQIDATLKSARLVNMDGVRAEVSGDLTYKRDRREALLKGDVRIDRVEAGLNDRLPREITRLKVREINKPGHADEAILAPEAPKIAALSRFDLKVKAPRRLFVRGRGLDSEWSGDLVISGSAAAPEIKGTVELVRGVFSFAGKDFTLTAGTLRFDGGSKIDPVMNVKAEYVSADITARLALTGPLSRPELALSSVPALPQDEVLARVLFGTSVQQLSAFEAVQLAGAVSSLASGGGFDVFGKARGILGLDRLSVGSNEMEGGGTAVTGGKYLTRDIYLEVTTDTSTGESKAVVRYDITKKLQIEAGVGDVDRTSVGIRWKEDY